MKAQYIGDSYDHVKRTLLMSAPEANWIAAMLLNGPASDSDIRCYCRFLSLDVPKGFRVAPSRSERPAFISRLRDYCDSARHDLFLDPCTGIRIDANHARSSRVHVYLHEIASLAEGSDRLVLCYDQGHSRGKEESSRIAKLEFLRKAGLHAWYYRSHVSFLAASSSRERLDSWVGNLRDMGLPCDRFHEFECSE